MPDEPRREAARGSAGPVWLRGAVIGIAALVVLGLGYLVLVLTSGDGVRPGTTVAGVDIGGLSQQEAIDTLNAEFGKRAAKDLAVVAGDQEFTIDPQAAGLVFDPAATVASSSGRVLNPIALLRPGTREVAPVITVDQAKLADQVGSIAVAVDVAPVEPTLVMKHRQPVLTPGKAGRALDQAALSTAIVDGLLQPRQPIKAPFTKAQPTVTPEAADAAVALAASAVSAPVIVSAREVVATLRPKAISRALSFTAEGGQLVPKLDGAVLHEAIADDLAAVETPGRDARFKIKGGRPVVVPSKVGNGISDDELAAAVVPVLGKQTPDRAVSVTIGTREPRITTEQAQSLCIDEKMSSFTQRFPYAAYRVQNIGQAAEYVNGTIIKPGETFSMNDTMKERTEENGYTKGFIISPGGIFAEEMGGGVSAAATTVWTGAFFAGLERVYTQAHSIYISRYQPGLEATVSWGNFDMKFRNNTPCGVLITTAMTNTSMTVTFWGTKQFDEVKAEFGPRREPSKFWTIHDESKDCLGQDGVDGFTIDVDRVFLKDGAEVGRETITTKYRATPEIICDAKKGKGDGPGGKKPKPSATPTPTLAPDLVAPAPGAGVVADAPGAAQGR